MASFLAAFVATAKAIPALASIVDTVVDLWLKAANEADQNAVNRQRKEREAIIASLKLPGLTNEQRTDLRRHLHSVLYGELSNKNRK